MSSFTDLSRIRLSMLEAVPMRDGTSLSADVYAPPGDGPWPVLLHLTPYDNNRSARAPRPGELPSAIADRCKRLAARGFVVAAVDVRGQGDSEGRFTPFSHERADGADAVAWARTLAGASGRVGIFGSGYAGFCAWAAAVGAAEAGAGVDAIASTSPFGGPGLGLPWSAGGALRLDPLFWTHLVGGRAQQPADAPPWAAIWRELPVSSLAGAVGRDDPWWSDWLAHPDPDDPFWEPLRLLDGVAALDAATLYVSGWWDPQLAAVRAYWDAGAQAPDAPDGRARRTRELVIGPWDGPAVRNPRRHVGTFDWTLESVLDAERLVGEFFERELGEAVSAGDTVRLFVTGRNAWLQRADWVPGCDERTLWLSSDGRANTRRGDGRLAGSPPGAEPADAYRYDPDNPVAWQQGFTTFSSNAPRPLVLDDIHITGRDDVLCYQGAFAEHPMTLLGRPRIELWAQTDAPDTDWFVLLGDVFPFEQRTLHLTHGVVRAAVAPGFEPGRPVRYEIELGEVAHELLPGHALRVTITSSLFPLYARNLNGSEPYVQRTQPRIAAQQVLHDAAHPSLVVLPIATPAQGGSR